MIRKTKEIKDFIKLVNDTFGKDAPMIQDYWKGDLKAIGLQKNNKLIYVAIYDKQDYFYECELLLDNPDRPYIPQKSDNTDSAESVLDVMSKFFEIKRKI